MRRTNCRSDMPAIDSVEYKFRLYIAGDSANSLQALTNLRQLCRSHLAGHFSIEIVDVFREPGRALNDGIFMTPTLLRLEPLPLQVIAGTLSDTATLMQTLDLQQSDMLESRSL